MNAHILDARIIALLTKYAGYLETAGNRTPRGGTPIEIPREIREETLQLAREVLATVPRVPAEVTA